MATLPSHQRYAGLTLPQWHQRIKDVNPKSATAASIVNPLIEIVGDANLPGIDREPFAVFLARVGEPARAVAPILADRLRKREAGDYLWAARALALMGPAAAEVTPELISFLRDDRLSAGDRQAAIEALARIGTAHPDAIPALLSLLHPKPGERNLREQAALRELAVAVTFVLGPDGEVAAPLLIRILRDPRESESIRRHAIVGLGALGERGGVAVRVLSEELIHRRSPALRDEAARALVNLGPPAELGIRSLLRDAKPGVAWRLADAYVNPLATLAQPASEVILRQLLHDPDARARVRAAEAWLRTHGAAPWIVRLAISLLADPNRDVRLRAKGLLVAASPLAPAEFRLVQQLAEGTGPAAQSARAALRRVTPAASSD